MVKRLGGSFSSWLRAFLIALVFLLVLRFFCFQFYMVQSTSMEKSLVPGDVVFVNKVSFGSRLPITILTVPFFSEIYLDLIRLPYLRIPGVSKLQQNDVLAFNYPVPSDVPVDRKPVYFKRLIALPGDTLQITRAKVMVNGVALKELPYYQHNYRFTYRTQKLPDELWKKYSFTEGGLIDSRGVYEFPMSQQMARQFREEQNVAGFREMVSFADKGEFGIFPDNPYFSWNRDNFGPVFIPRKGATVELTKKNFILYRTIIEKYEKNRVEIKGDKLFINEEIKRSYTFKMNYYFVLDDNRHGAKDSRFWGFLPEDHIIGKVNAVFFSLAPNGKPSQWKRILKSVN